MVTSKHLNTGTRENQRIVSIRSRKKYKVRIKGDAGT